MQRCPLATAVTAALVALVTLLASGQSCALGLAAPADRGGRHTAPTAGSTDAPSTSAVKAPSSPPLTVGQDDADGDEEAAAAPSGQADPLVSNGLGSPTCRAGLAGELSANSRRNCETSGFLAAPAPTGNYGIDVHIDTGFLGVSSNAVASLVQDFLITPLWMALVWAVHALLVMLEWCFSVDLLRGASTGGLGGALRAMQASFTEPWLALALACASLLAVYRGLIRRRVAQTLGEALLMGAMMAGGIWIISDPLGTVGALGEWADQASLGTLAVASSGSPIEPVRRLGSSLELLFATAIEGPWCYLEFGDVGWCRTPAQIDPQLHAAALKIAAEESSQIVCEPGADALTPCAHASAGQQKLLEHSAQVLRDARTNGEIFLALPANGVARNSINEQGSLLRTLCQSTEATACRGPTAAQAEFRTQGATLARLGGLLLIAGGLLGMLLLLGFLAVRLLIAAVLSLLYVVLAPALVLAPAFGDGGRTLFRRWAGQLLAAVVSKLLFSFLLGAVLAVLRILTGLVALGWWTQWLLISAFWWAAYLRRHQLLAVPSSEAPGPGLRRHTASRSLARRMSAVLEPPRTALAAARWAHAKFSKPPPEVRERRRPQVHDARPSAAVDEQLEQMLACDQRGARELADRAPALQRDLARGRARLVRIERERDSARRAGDSRRAAELDVRAGRIRGQLTTEQVALDAAQRVVQDAERSARRGGRPFSSERREVQRRLIDEQSALPPASVRTRAGEARRDYAALAGLAGLGREEYEQLAPRPQRATRMQIDRELDLRRELTGAMRSSAAAGDGAFARGRSLAGEPGGQRVSGVREHRPRASAAPGSRPTPSGIDRWRQGEPSGQPKDDAQGSSSQSTVMRDAHAVAARRKRQLGRDRD